MTFVELDAYACSLLAYFFSVFTFGLSSPGSDDVGPCTGSSADAPASSVAAPLILSLSPPVSPEEFECLWLQQHAVCAEQGRSDSGMAFGTCSGSAV